MSLYLKIKYYLRRIYRLSLPTNKWEDLVWKDLKQLHLDAKWHSGVHEHEKLINCVFNINDNKSLQYFHYIHYGQFHVRVKVVEEFEAYSVEVHTMHRVGYRQRSFALAS